MILFICTNLHKHLAAVWVRCSSYVKYWSMKDAQVSRNRNRCYFFSQDGDGYTWHTAQELGNSNYENFCFVGADQQRVLAAPTARFSSSLHVQAKIRCTRAGQIEMRMSKSK